MDQLKILMQQRHFAKEAGFPLMIKATSGGGGKDMRIVREESELEDAFHRAEI